MMRLPGLLARQNCLVWRPLKTFLDGLGDTERALYQLRCVTRTEDFGDRVARARERWRAECRAARALPVSARAYHEVLLEVVREEARGSCDWPGALTP